MNIKEIKEMIQLMNENSLTEIELEQDGDRWIADVVDLPGVMVYYGATKGEAFCAAEALALEVLADRLKHGEDLLTGHPAAALQRPALGGVAFTAA